jgi:hypothetical protein
MESVVFRSKLDTWLAAVIAVPAVVALGIAATLLVSDMPARWPIALLLGALGGVLPLYVIGATRYTVGDGEIRIVSGPFRWRVALRDIRTVRPTRNPLSSPALSLDRLRIEYGASKWVMVSPRDQDAFVRALRRHGAALDQVATPNR